MIGYVVNQFIYEKVKLIYKTIRNLKTTKSEIKSMLREDRGALETVNQDVISWAENKQKEIQLLRDQEEYRRDFLGNVSHELKTPIFNIQGYVHTLLDGGLEDEEINRKFLIRADKSVERMISVVEDLDVISRLEAGILELNIQRINIIELAKEVMEMEEMKAEKRNITIRFNERYDKPIYVMADADQIKRVYINLLDNGIKYGSADGSIKLRFYDMDQNILCEVADDGSGIEPKHLPRLFERFYRVDKARDRHTGGTGLGLSIVKHIIDAHKQTINVRSLVGGNSGTTFSFTLKEAK
ncbi:MAG: two-component system phosphate regulon sensor histidine kinase PhoR [Bacteroidia bacterium]|jgi:two-component system phosphate regulon sensor histidine kinase PhoR